MYKDSFERTKDALAPASGKCSEALERYHIS
jgi:hypothetical protein